MATVTNKLATASKQTFSTFLTQDAVRNKINQTLGGKDGQRFLSSILSAVSVNPALQMCEHSSILSAALLGESLKLSPSPQLGQYYLVPFKVKRKDERGKEYQVDVATFVLGYKGYIQLAIRSGYYKKLNVLAIKEGELIRYDPLTEEIEVKLIEDEEQREKAKTIGYYAMFEYVSGFRKAIYWSRTKMELHADKYSKAFSLAAFRKLQEGKIPQDELWKYSSFWYKDFDGMAFKTMLRQLISKWGIMSIEMQTAFEADQAEEYNPEEFVSNKPHLPEIVVEEPPIPEPAIEVEEEDGAAILSGSLN